MVVRIFCDADEEKLGLHPTPPVRIKQGAYNTIFIYFLFYFILPYKNIESFLYRSINRSIALAAAWFLLQLSNNSRSASKLVQAPEAWYLLTRPRSPHQGFHISILLFFISCVIQKSICMLRSIYLFIFRARAFSAAKYILQSINIYINFFPRACLSRRRASRSTDLLRTTMTTGNSLSMWKVRYDWLHFLFNAHFSYLVFTPLCVYCFWRCIVWGGHFGSFCR